MKLIRLMVLVMLAQIAAAQGVKQVATINDMRNERVDSWQSNREITTGGYWSNGDGGGGRFKWVTGALPGAGTNVYSTFTSTHASSMTGYWYRVDFDNPVDIRKAGGADSGTIGGAASAAAKNTAAEQYLFSAGYGVSIPAGFFPFASTIIVPDGGVLVGTGYESHVMGRHTNAVVGNSITGSSAPYAVNVSIRNLSINGWPGYTCNYGLAITNTMRCTFEGLFIEGGSLLPTIGDINNNVLIGCSTGVGPYNTWFDHCLFSSPQLTNIVLDTKAYGIGQITIRDSYIYGGTHCIGQDGTGTGSDTAGNITIDGCTVEGASLELVKVMNIVKWSLKDSRFEASGSVTNVPIVATLGTTKLTVDNTEVVNSTRGASSTASAPYAFYLPTAVDVIMNNARSQYMTNSGVFFPSAARGVIFNLCTATDIPGNYTQPWVQSTYSGLGTIVNNTNRVFMMTEGSNSPSDGLTNLFRVDGSIQVGQGYLDTTNRYYADMRVLNLTNFTIQPLNTEGLVMDTVLDGRVQIKTNLVIGGTGHTNALDVVGSAVVSGSVGINTTGPDRKLDVLDASAPQIRWTMTDGSVFADSYMSATGLLFTNTVGAVTFGRGSVVDMVITNGTVGIGTAATEGLLHAHTSSAGTVTANSNGDELVLESGNAVTGMSLLSPNNGYNAIYFGHPVDNDYNAITAGGSAVATTGDRGAMMFYTSGLVEKMRITSTGSVGIGTNAPTRKAEIFDTTNPQLRLAQNYAGTVYTDMQTGSAGQFTITPSSGPMNVTVNTRMLSATVTNFIEQSEVTLTATEATNYVADLTYGHQFIQVNGADVNVQHATNMSTVASFNRNYSLYILGDGSARNLTVPASWHWIGSAAPTVTPISKYMVISLVWRGSGTSQTNGIASYSTEP